MSGKIIREDKEQGVDKSALFFDPDNASLFLVHFQTLSGSFTASAAKMQPGSFARLHYLIMLFSDSMMSV